LTVLTVMPASMSSSEIVGVRPAMAALAAA